MTLASMKCHTTFCYLIWIWLKVEWPMERIIDLAFGFSWFNLHWRYFVQRFCGNIRQIPWSCSLFVVSECLVLATLVAFSSMRTRTRTTHQYEYHRQSAEEDIHRLVLSIVLLSMLSSRPVVTFLVGGWVIANCSAAGSDKHEVRSTIELA
jgi:hypothetical protein